MNTAPASENGPYPTNHTRPFFYAQPTAQQPFPNPWYLGQVYNPYCLPAPGFRSGNPYFPFYSVALPEYPGFYIPQPQVHARMNRRPHFTPNPPPPPMFYHATRFRHFSSPGKRTETKETQTDLRQQENLPKKNGNTGTHTRGCDAANITGLSSSVGTVNDSISENLESSRTSVAALQERDFHKNTCTSASYRNMLPSSYAFEKEEVRIEYGGGSPAAIQLWKSYKETIPMYDLGSEKEMADNVVQRDVYSVSSCEGVRYGPQAEEEELVLQNSAFTKEDCRAPLPVRGVDAVQEKDITCIPGQIIAVEPEFKKGVKASNDNVNGLEPVYQIQSSNIRDLSNSSHDYPVSRKNVASKNLVSNGLCNEEESDHGKHDGLVEQAVEEVKDLNLVNAGETITCDGELPLWAEDAVDGYSPSPSWLACLDNLQTDCNYDICLAQRKPKRTSVLSITSDDISSRDEGSSMDNTSASYFVPDYLLKKSIYSFRKSTDGSEKEKIKSGGSLNEDEECVQRQKTNVVGTQYDASQSKGLLGEKVEVSSKGRKLGVSLRDVSRRKLYSLKKKPRKNMSLSEPEDSEEFWVIEETVESGGEDDDEDDDAEYFLQKSIQQGQLSISNGKVYKQASKQRVVWKPGKGSAPAQLIRWPSCEVKMKKKGLESSAHIRRPKQKVQEAECESGSYVKRSVNKPDRGLNEVSEQRRSSQKSVGGKSQKCNMGMPNEDYWSGRGAKPKLSEQPYDGQPPVKIIEQDKPQRRRGSFKQLPKSKTPLPEPEEVEVWVSPKSFGSKGRGTNKTVYRR